MPSATSTPFVLGGRLPRRLGRDQLPGAAAIGVVLAVVLVPVRGLYYAAGASMDEGFTLVFPRLVWEGKVANVDFLHLYGPTSLDVLALWYRVFGDSLASERTFGLIQILGIVYALYALGRVRGHVVAAVAAIVATFLIITPVGISALAWNGGVALGLWAVVFAARSRATGRRADRVAAGILTGLALGYRPDLVIAIGLVLVVVTWRRRRELGEVVLGAVVGLIPMWVHLAWAGPVDSIDGMLVDPVFRLRAGRRLPAPPSWGQVDGALQAAAEGVPPWWRFPALTASHQLFVWFWLSIVVTIAVLVWAWYHHRRHDDDDPASIALLAWALFGVGIIGQALQRPDSTHLAFVAVVSWPLLVVVVHDLVRDRLHLARWAGTTGAVVVGLLMFVACPFFTYRAYLLHARVSVGDLPPPFEIERDGRRFFFGDYYVAKALSEMMPVLAERSEPGDRLIVGPADLSRTIYSDAVVYWMFPELEPATYYIEMDPGVADREGSGLAEEIADADFLVLTNIWTGWYEPNASSEHQSDEHNRAVADHFCLVDRFEDNLVLLFERCEGGGGLSGADIAGRYPLTAG